MKIGYDLVRPAEKNYRSFLSSFRRGISDLGMKDLSVIIYGSYARGEYTHGRSAIDALLTFPDYVVIDKDKIRRVAVSIAEAQKGNNVPFKPVPTDLTIMMDGRFNPYSTRYAEYFKNEGRLVAGPDYREEFKFEMPTKPEQETLRAGLKFCRRSLLMSEYNKQSNYYKFLDEFEESLDIISRCSQHVFSMIDGKIRRDRFSALDLMSDVFHDVDVNPLEDIKMLFKDPTKLDLLYHAPEQLLETWCSAVDFFESLVCAYMRKFPNNKMDR